MVRALRAIRAAAHDEDALRIVFVLIGYHDPDRRSPGRRSRQRCFRSLFGLFASMPAHERHLAREMKLVGQPKIEEAEPYVSRLGGGGD